MRQNNMAQSERSPHCYSTTSSTRTRVGSTRELDGNDDDPIAIVGFSFKFPQEGDTQDGFWKMLLEKLCAMTEFPADRMSVKGHYRKEKRQTTVIKTIHRSDDP
jgi:hypothetical protein